MKKILTLISLVMLGWNANGQTVLNELYTDPGTGGAKSEFIELYNSATSGQDLDCYTILSYFENGANKGWYVIDLPRHFLPSKQWYVLAAASPFDVQSQTGIIPDAVWNGLSGDAYLKKFMVNGTGYLEVAPGVVKDLLMDVQPAGISGHNYFIFLLKNGIIINGLWGGGSTGALPAGITMLPELSIPAAGNCGGTSYKISFNNLAAVEFVHESVGTDNGYARTSDGKCGSWDKTSNAASHNPGVSNGSATGLSGDLQTSQLIQCNAGVSTSTVNYNITGVSGSATEADDFPVEVQLYNDNGTMPGQLDGLDEYQRSKFDTTLAKGTDTFTIPKFQSVILVYKTQRGCFDKVVSLVNSCAPLAVLYLDFTAVRMHTAVRLQWQTAWESRSAGFTVERMVNGGNWEVIGQVMTAAPEGNSELPLQYFFADRFPASMNTAYRVFQTDFDGQHFYTDVRMVGAMGESDGIRIYPNPALEGTVNVVTSNFTDPLHMEIADLSGRIIRKWDVQAEGTVSQHQLAPGTYFLRALNMYGGSLSTYQFMVIR